MGTAVGNKLDQRVIKAAYAALTDHHYVTAIDVLIGMGWLTTPQVERWRQGRVDCLESQVTVNLSKISTAMRTFRRWARAEGLHPSEAAYMACSRDRRPLRFSESEDPRIEAAYRTRWISSDLSEAKRARLAEQQGRAPDLVVISPVKDWTCGESGGSGA